MTAATLLLGPFLFQDFELPASIAWGGGQHLTIHRMPGGARIIDAMGRDDADISWTGIFSGPDAAIRARALDLMRADGSAWPLTWSGYFYSVVIAHLHIDHQRPNWLPYRITCTVLRDEASAILLSPLSIAASTEQDLSQAAIFAPNAFTTDPNAQLAAPIGLAKAPDIAGQAAQQSAANAYLNRAARNATFT